MKLEIKFSNERLITPSGLAIVGTVLAKSNFVKRINQITRAIQKRSQPLIKSADILLTYIGVLARAKTRFEAVGEMGDDPEAFKISLGLSGEIPSVETTRQRMDAMASSLGDELRTEILDANVDLLKNCAIRPTALPNDYVPVDIDVTAFDNSKTKKQGVSRTYKGFDGYAPIMAYIGTEGYLINTELREGSQHCQKHTPQLLCETLKLSHQPTESPLLIRLDSGNDAAVNLGILIEDGSYFVVKRNLRRSESKEAWLDKAKAVCLPENISKEREGKTVYIGSSWKDVEYTDSDGNKKTICLQAIQSGDGFSNVLLRSRQAFKLLTERSLNEFCQLAVWLYIPHSFLANNNATKIPQVPSDSVVLFADCFNLGDSAPIHFDIVLQITPQGFKKGFDSEKLCNVIQRRNACLLESGNGIFTAYNDFFQRGVSIGRINQNNVTFNG